MKTLRRLLPILLGLLLAGTARAAEWTEDYSAALAQAKIEHRKLLLDFTGSDWCVWCHKIDAEVFAQPEFSAYARQHLILVKLDFPRNRQMPDAVKQQNARLKARFQVRGYPTLIVLDANETKLFEQVGYAPGGPRAFIAALEKGGTRE